MRAAQMRGRGAPPGLIETLFNHSRTSSDRKCRKPDETQEPGTMRRGMIRQVMIRHYSTRHNTTFVFYTRPV